MQQTTQLRPPGGAGVGAGTGAGAGAGGRGGLVSGGQSGQPILSMALTRDKGRVYCEVCKEDLKGGGRGSWY